MNTNNTIYETGATSHSVNDLILFTDNTIELAKLRDSIYTHHIIMNLAPMPANYASLLTAAIATYIKEFPQKEDHKHIYGLTEKERKEYIELYINDFQNWKSEKGYK